MRLSRDDLMDDAVRRAGFDDFGEPAFLEGLDTLIGSIGENRQIPENKRPMVEARVTEPLVQRLRLYGERARHPEIARQKIVAPLIVIGLPRSGTTFLHALLSQDPVARSPMAWQWSNLSPPPRQETIETDPRIAATEAAQAQLPEDFKLMHLVGPRLPEECNMIMTMGFHSPNFDSGLHVPEHMAWYMNSDAAPALEVHRHTLQHLQAFTAGERWVLKAPPHMWHMAALIAAYPDAQIVFPHRDPAATIPSVASLIAAIHGWIFAEVNKPMIGREQLEYWAIALERALAFRNDPAQAHRFFDVSYADLVARPMETAAAIYDHFGLTLSAQAEAAMRTFLAEKPKDKLGTHRYTLEEFGLTSEMVADRFRNCRTDQLTLQQ
jgi:hypothetical protein